MNIEQIKKTWSKHLEKEDGMALISTKDFKWLVKEAENAERLRIKLEAYREDEFLRYKHQ